MLGAMVRSKPSQQVFGNNLSEANVCIASNQILRDDRKTKNQIKRQRYQASASRQRGSHSHLSTVLSPSIVAQTGHLPESPMRSPSPKQLRHVRESKWRSHFGHHWPARATITKPGVKRAEVLPEAALIRYGACRADCIIPEVLPTTDKRMFMEGHTGAMSCVRGGALLGRFKAFDDF